MFLIENDASTTLVCQLCGGPIFPEQPFIYRDAQPIHSESADCSPEKVGIRTLTSTPSNSAAAFPASSPMPPLQAGSIEGKTL